jgi:hypothetical protein
MYNNKSCLLTGLAVAVSAVTARADLSVTIGNESQQTAPFTPNNVATGGGQLTFQGGQSQWYVTGQNNGDQNYFSWGDGSFGSSVWKLTGTSVVNGTTVDTLSTGSSAFTFEDGSAGTLTGTIGPATLEMVQGIAVLQFAVTSVNYSGSDSDLQALAKNGLLEVDLILNGMTSLSEFQDGTLGNDSFNYGGDISSISPIPEPGTMVAGLAMVGLMVGAGLRAKRQ